MSSVRSRAWFGPQRRRVSILHAALAACGQHLVGHGGHEAAAGLTIDESAIERVSTSISVRMRSG